MKYSQKDFEKHLKEEHDRSPFSQYLKEIVYGGTDGIVTTFAVVAGFAGAQTSANLGLEYSILLLFGFANLFADAASMGLGNFLASRSDKNLYLKERRKEEGEVEKSFNMEVEETKLILQERGFSKEDAGSLVKIYSKNQEYWVDFMMRYELDMCGDVDDNAIFTSLATFFSFIFFGFMPLLPYVFLREIVDFRISIFFTIIALILLGLLRWKATHEKLWKSLLETVFIGGLSALIAYFVGTFFKI